jgi:Tfp pilus assembly protein PilV
LMGGVVMLLGLLGLASLQVVGVRANHFGRHMAQASNLAQDLSESIQRWDYNDARLSPATIRIWNVNSAASTALVDLEWDMGRASAAKHTDGSTYLADFSDLASDPNARVAGALSATYTGLSSDVDGDSVADYVRYWNVWSTSFDGVFPTGKTIQTVVRWKEPAFGWRQTTASTFKPLPSQQDVGG